MKWFFPAAAMALLISGGAQAQIFPGGGGGSGGGITALTGGVTASGSGSVVATVVTNANLTGPITSVGNATTFVGPFTGDCSNSGLALTCTKTSGTAFATSATTDTTNASNISSGTLNAGRLPTTAVTPGSYTATNLTVDADGRITAAANGSGGGITCSGCTANTLPKTTGTGTLGDSSIADNSGVTVGSPTGGAQGAGTINIPGGYYSNGVQLTTSSGGTTLNTSSLYETLPNASSGGTANGKLVLDTGGTIKTITTAQTSDAIGICVNSVVAGTACGTTGNAAIAIAGQSPCVFDGNTTAGDFVQASTTVAGDCHDAGASVPALVSILGQVLSTNVGGGTYQLDISPIGAMAANNKKAQPGGTSGQVQYNSSGAFGGFTMAGDCTLSQPNITCTKSSGTAFGTAAFDNTGTSGANIPLLSAANSWGAAQRGNTETPTIATTTFTPAGTAQNIRIDFPATTCTCTIANFSTITAGQSGVIELVQGATSASLNPTWGSAYEYPGGTSTIVLTTTLGGVDYIPYYVESTGTFIVLGSIDLKPVH